jgi:hypothetical protein
MATGPSSDALPAAPARRDSLRTLLLLYVLLAGSTLVAFAGVMDNDLINLDDTIYVREYPEVANGLIRYSREGTLEFNPNHFLWAFTSTRAAGYWHPLTWLSLQIDSTLDYRPVSYHRTNLIVHLCNVLLLAEVLRRMTGQLWPSAIVAALFAVHPLHVESVAWVSERKDVLSTFFGLLALAAYVRFARRPRWIRMALVSAVYACSLMSKPTLVTLPFLLLVLDYWPLRRWGRPTTCVGEETIFVRAPFARLVLEKAPLFLLSAAGCVMIVLAQFHGDAIVPLDQVGLGLRVSNAVNSTVAYMAQMFWPINLAAFYPYPLDGLPWGKVAAEVLLLVAVTVAVCRLVRAHPYLPVGWFWFLGTLVPVIGLVQVGTQARADRFTYVPLVGLFVMLVWGLRDLVPAWRQGVLVGFAAGIVICCVLLTRAQVQYWADSITLWKHTLEVTEDNYMGQLYYSYALAGRGDRVEALTHAQEALRLQPRFPHPHYWCGVMHEINGHWEEAEACYRAAWTLQPDEKYRQAGRRVKAKREAGRK